VGVGVFGHRGASGYRPENTLEAFELAFQQGADAIECDLVPTLDGHLVIRHENRLSHTTNVAALPEFASKRIQEFQIWQDIDDWCTEKLTLAELKQLRAIERIPDVRPGSAKFDGRFEIPTIDELLLAPFAAGKTLILELKEPNFFFERGIDTPAMLVERLAAIDWQSRGISIVMESFDRWSLLRCKELARAAGIDAKFVLLTERWWLPKTGAAELTAFIDQVAKDFDGLSVELAAIAELWPSFVAQAHERGLLAYVWTARAEDSETSIDEYYAHIIELGADGIFADQPDLLRACVDALA